MSDYTVNTDFVAIDALPPADAGKKVLGTAWSAEFDEIETSIATKADLIDETLTGTTTLAAGAVTTFTGTGLATSDQRRETAPVAFFASDTYQAESTTTQQLTFPTEAFDLSGNFASDSFTAPYAGVYFFSAHAAVQNTITLGNARFYINLRVNGIEVARSNIVRTPNGSSIFTLGASLDCVLNLAAGDVVIIKQLNMDTAAGFWGLYATYFCGALLART